MTTWNNASGVSTGSFQFGTKGPTIRQGTAIPDSSVGADGDLYVLVTSPFAVYSRVSGSWKLLVDPAKPVVTQVAIRGVPLTVGSTTDFVIVEHNPWTADSTDSKVDSTMETIDDDPLPWTDVILPEGPEGKAVSVMDAGSRASAFHIYIEDQASNPIDGNVHVALVTDGSSMDVQYSGGAWRVVG